MNNAMASYVRVVDAVNYRIGRIMMYGVFVMMAGWFVLRLFGVVPSILEMGWIGIGFSAVIVVIAAFNLIIDLIILREISCFWLILTLQA